MKKNILNSLLLILCIHIFPLNSIAQYLQSFNGDAQWNTYSWFEVSNNTTYQLHGDTLINDTNYKKIINFPTNYPGSYNQVDFVREDTLSKKIFQRLNASEFIIYDYALSAGDTFQYKNPQWPGIIYNLVLDSITDTIYNPNTQFLLTCDLDKKVFYFHDAQSPWNNNIIWVEGIGSLAGPLLSFYDWQGGNEGETLLCHFNHENTKDFHYIYMYEPSPCQGPLGQDEKKPLDEVLIFPNPFCLDLVTVQGKNIKTIEILSPQGQICLQNSLAIENRLVVNMENKPKGIYFIRITFINNSKNIKKIIKI